jgi:hypothetical protein
MSDELVEGNEDNSDPQEGRSRRNRELETNFDYELHVQNIYMFDGAGGSRYQLRDEDFFRHPERIYPKNKWVK